MILLQKSEISLKVNFLSRFAHSGLETHWIPSNQYNFTQIDEIGWQYVIFKKMCFGTL